ncbi:MAG: Dam family site-specific DNA-(adenine-N6)-methyltransferase [Acidobacteriota bacterium]
MGGTDTRRSSAATQARPSPFLKWAGGKRQLLPELRRYYPREFRGYVEPFVGSGAVYFDLYAMDRLRGRRVVLMDDNADLVGCYLTVRDHPAAVIRHLTTLAAERRLGPSEHYYNVRDRRFNPTRAALRKNGGIDPAAYTPRLAAMLIYLNRTGFNGLFRLNADGLFNVPAGRYANPTICDAEKLRAVAHALAERRTQIRRGWFEQVPARARPGDFVYLDPPYAPLSTTSRFTSYTAGQFSSEDQIRLQAVVIELARRGCHVLLSNSVAPEVRGLYDENDAARAAGLRAYRVNARRAINSKASQRGPIEEYIVTNIDAGTSPCP